MLVSRTNTKIQSPMLTILPQHCFCVLDPKYFSLIIGIMGKTNRLDSISADRLQPLVTQSISLAGRYCGSTSFDSPYHS